MTDNVAHMTSTALVTKTSTDFHIDAAITDRASLAAERKMYEDRIANAYKTINETEPKLKETISLQQITEDRITTLQRSKING